MTDIQGMDLASQWPAVMHADPDVVEIVDGSHLRTFDAHTRAERPKSAGLAGGTLPLADGASVDDRSLSFYGQALSTRREFSWRGQRVSGVRAAAWVGGEWYVATDQALVRVRDGHRWPNSDLHLVAPAGDELVLVEGDGVVRFAGDRERCRVAMDGTAVEGAVANADHVLLSTRHGVVELDHDCHVIGTSDAGGGAWAFDGARAWWWDGVVPRVVALPDLTVLTPDQDPDGTWAIGERAARLAGGLLTLTAADGTPVYQSTDDGLSGISAVAGDAAGDVAVTDGRVVVLFGGGRWVEPGVVTAIRSVGPAGVVVEERDATPGTPAREVTLGVGPFAEAAPGVPEGALVAAPTWSGAAIRSRAPDAWSPSRPIGSVRCQPMLALVGGSPRTWSFGVPTLVAPTLPSLLPDGVAGLAAGTLPGRDDLHTRGQTDATSLARACDRPLGDQAWVVDGHTDGAVYANVWDAVHSMEASAEGWAHTPSATPAAEWSVPADGSLAAVRDGIVFSTPFGSALFGVEGPRLSTPGDLVDAGAAWISRVGPWSLVLDRASATLRDTLVGRAVAVDETGALREEADGTVRVELAATRGAIAWGPALGSGATVAGWHCGRDAHTGRLGACVQVPEAPAEPRVGDARYTVEEGTLRMRRGERTVLSREDVDAVVVAGDTLLVRGHAANRPWVRYGDDGAPLQVLPPGDVIQGVGGLWVLSDDRLYRYDR